MYVRIHIFKILNIKKILYQDDVYIFLYDERNALIFAHKFGSFECLKLITQETCSRIKHTDT